MKFISSSYDNESGESVVIIQHLGKKFTGTAKIHPDEYDKRSEYAGCAYADMRATIEAIKYEKELVKTEIANIEKYLKACECYKDFDKESPTAKVLYRQLNKKKKNFKYLKNWMVLIKKHLKETIIKREKFLEKLNELRKSKNIK